MADVVEQIDENEELLFEGVDTEEGDGEIAVAPEERTVRTRPADPEITSLYEKWKRGRLILQPDFQRQFVWDRVKASRLVESALLSVPIPVVYLAEGPDGKESVIDGQQRLTSFFSFLDGKFPGGESFRLTGLKVFQELNRKSFSDLDDDTQDKIRYYVLRTITILKDSDPELKFEIFERLNMGSIPLNDMELRNCVYRGPYMTLLKELAVLPDFVQLMGFKEPDRRMRDVELVLRFASFFHATYLKYKSPMRQFFNRDMEKYQHISKQDADELRTAFKNSIQIVRSLFGDSAFKRFHRGDPSDENGVWETKKFNASLYDVMMGVFCDCDKNQVYKALDSLREAWIELMASNDEFIDAILLSTSSQAKVCKRFDLARGAVEDVLKNYRVQPRCFTLELKRELYDTNPTCQICKQKIQLLDDTAVDHVEQYWRGGQTIPENARLTHRYCNVARSRKD